MADTPDLSKLVGLIMQNPELISQISALAKSDNTGKDTSSEEETLDEMPTTEAVSVSAPTSNNMRSHRQELLYAMKPYLSESRRTAIDSMISISEIIDMMRKK